MKGNIMRVSSMLLYLILMAFTDNAVAFVVSPTVVARGSTETGSNRWTHFASSSPNDTEETTKKYGLEAGLFKSLQQDDGGESAKSLLKKYGIAYLATSIPLALVSFIICYLLVDNGIDVAALLAKVGIVQAENSEVASKAGTFAIAYAAHKAASPIRFPPTVLLTPVVAKLIGKEPEEEAVES